LAASMLCADNIAGNEIKTRKISIENCLTMISI
jgi:hypothetical protein